MNFQVKKKKVTEGILKAFTDKYPHLEAQDDFETIWPASAWDTLHTETRTFDIHLKYTTGKVLSITEVTA